LQLFSSCSVYPGENREKGAYVKDKDHTQIREEVREQYAGVATSSGCGCGPSSSCCGGSSSSSALGYTPEELSRAVEGSDLFLGCGNPQAIADLKPGQRVLDLGSGAGFDAFLAADSVGAHGQVIGVDMTPEMVAKARANALSAQKRQVEFRLGEIEHLPVEDASIDVIISNCVINLSPDKQQVLHEAFRVLKPGGRLALSDIINTAELPPDVKESVPLYTGCVSGAASAEELKQMLETAGFTRISIDPKPESREFIQHWVPGRGIDEYIRSADITAVKPVTA
jgi:SAM-dependent methyltransferase